MDYYSLFTTQITDILRIGLLAGLIYTTERTRTQTGIMLPLIAGIVFVAVIIPSAISQSSAELIPSIGVGLVVNALIVSALWLAWSAFKSRK